MRHAVYCYIEGRSNAWEGLCLDFDIAVQGDSFEDVSVNLKVAIDQYLERVHQLPEPQQKAFLNRRVPIGLRLKLVLSALSWGLRPASAGISGPERYSIALPCPA